MMAAMGTEPRLRIMRLLISAHPDGGLVVGEIQEGLDMTDEMLALARENQRKSGLENVEFLKGQIEQIPLSDNSVDVIISNCVINLSADKDRVLAEAVLNTQGIDIDTIAPLVDNKFYSGFIRATKPAL